MAGDEVEERVGDSLRTAWREEYVAIKTEVDPLPGAAELVRALVAAGSAAPGWRVDLRLDGDVLLSQAVRNESPTPLLDLVARHRGDELVAAHPDRAVDPPQRQHDLVSGEGPLQASAWWYVESTRVPSMSNRIAASSVVAIRPT